MSTMLGVAGAGWGRETEQRSGHILKDTWAWGASQVRKEGVAMPGGFRVVELALEGGKGGEMILVGKGLLIVQGVMRNYHGWGTSWRGFNVMTFQKERWRRQRTG